MKNIQIPVFIFFISKRKFIFCFFVYLLTIFILKQDYQKIEVSLFGIVFASCSTVILLYLNRKKQKHFIVDFFSYHLVEITFMAILEHFIVVFAGLSIILAKETILINALKKEQYYHKKYNCCGK
ncbi:MAG: hypothetical protein K2X39_06630 [Silvanigrellaceae bacterium]|nr:hypothetical protein [Silvanigrellaceae bacterium]